MNGETATNIMKLTIIPLVDPTEQQYLDLYKIWTDQTRNHVDDLLKSEQKIYAARFNDRLLGAAKVQINHQQGIISHFLIREITRRRGVGLYLLDEICRQQPQVTHWLFSLEDVTDANKNILIPFLLACGFTETANENQWEKRV